MKKFRKGVLVIVYKLENSEISYLLLKRKLHWIGWESVKGGIEKGESKIQAVKRELKEETNLKAEKIVDMKIRNRFFYPKYFHGWPGYVGMEYKIFAVKVSGKVRFYRIEHSGFRWMNFKQAYAKLTFKEQKDALKKVNERLNS